MLKKNIFSVLPMVMLFCYSPEDPFEKEENVKGILTITSMTDTVNSDSTEGIFIDSTLNPITIKTHVVLPALVDSGNITVVFQNGFSETISSFDSLFLNGQNRDHRDAETTLVFQRGGTMIARLTLFKRHDPPCSSEVKMFLYRKPVPLEGISLDSVLLSPGFSDSVMNYSGEVDNRIAITTIRPTLDNPFARFVIASGESISSMQPCSLSVGMNRFTITTIADDDSTIAKYAIAILRKPGTIATLDSVVLFSGGDTLRYRQGVFRGDSDSLEVSNAVDTVTFIPWPGHPEVSVIANESVYSPRTGTYPKMALTTGNNKIVMIAVAEDTSIRREYVFTVNRRPNGETHFFDLKPSVGTFDKTFDSAVFFYPMTVADSIDSIGFTMTCHENAEVTIDGKCKDAKSYLKPNKFTYIDIIVTAEDRTTRTYTVGVIRNGSSNAFLRNIHYRPEFSRLIPVFQPETTSYELRICADSSEVSLNPEPSNSRAKVKVSGNSIGAETWHSGISLNKGIDTIIQIDVTSEDNYTDKRYTVLLKRAFSITPGVIGSGVMHPAAVTDAFVKVPVVIRAIPDKGFHFTGWVVDTATASVKQLSDTVTTVTVKADATVKAQFDRNRYFLKVSCNFHGTASGSDTLLYGIADTITAKPDSGYHFVVWRSKNGNALIADSTMPTTPVALVNGDDEVTAIFAINQFELRVLSADTNQGTVSEGRTISYNETAVIRAYPKTDYVFQVWRVVNGSARIDDSTNSVIDVKLTSANAEIRAFFRLRRDTIYVDSAATGATTGQNWRHAFTSFQAAVNAADGVQGSVIRIAKGTYLPSKADRNACFILKNKIKVYGGYPNGGGQRDTSKLKTVFSGEIQGDGDSSNNAYAVISAQNLDSTVLLDGVTITGGYCDSAWSGGMSLVQSSITINGCTFSRNYQGREGGAIVVVGGSPVISNCTFRRNGRFRISANKGGGAIAIFRSAPLIKNCTFIENHSVNWGGAIASGESKINIVDCRFIKNSCEIGGGGAITSTNDTIQITNCIFDSNCCSSKANANGGAINGSSSSVQISGCRFNQNSISGQFCTGGAVCLQGNSIISRCSFTSNANYGVTCRGGALVLAQSFNCLNSLFFDNLCQSTEIDAGKGFAQGGAMITNGGSNGTIANCTFTKNASIGITSFNGALYFEGSINIANSILWNDSASMKNDELWSNDSINPITINNCLIQGGYWNKPNHTIESIINQDPLLGPLDSTGTVWFIPIPANSPARDSGTVNLSSGVDISTDIRGVTRDSKPDIGAFEFKK